MFGGVFEDGVSITKRLTLLVGALLVVGCSSAASKQPGQGAAEPAASKQPTPVVRQTSSPGTIEQSPGVKPVSQKPQPSIPVILAGPVPPARRLPEPNIPIAQPPYDESVPHPLPIDNVDVARVRGAVEEAARNWARPGTFHVNSYWRIAAELRVASGFLDGVMVAGVVTLPTEGPARFYPFSKSGGGGGPATIVGVRGDWVLVRHGLTYGVFNYRTGETDISDENANPGKRTVLSPEIIGPEDALAAVSKGGPMLRNWWVWFEPELTFSTKDGGHEERAVWVVQALSPSPNIAFFVDAETGEQIALRQTEAPSPSPEDHGFISRSKAIEMGLQGVDTRTVEVVATALLENFQFDHPVEGPTERAIWRLELVGKEHRRPMVMIIDAKTGRKIPASSPPSGK